MAPDLEELQVRVRTAEIQNLRIISMELTEHVDRRRAEDDESTAEPRAVRPLKGSTAFLANKLNLKGLPLAPDWRGAILELPKLIEIVAINRHGPLTPFRDSRAKMSRLIRSDHSLWSRRRSVVALTP